MNLTNEQIARVFAMYPKTPCFIHSRKIISKGHIIDFTCRGYPEIHFYDGEGRPTIDYTKDAQLLLTPLSAISDEDAIEVAKIECNYYCPNYEEFDFSKFRLRDQRNAEPQYNGIFFDLYNEEKQMVGCPLRLFLKFFKFYYNGMMHPLSYRSVQYLIQKGYAVPLFIEVGHPDNGKTAIELGIAIDKSQIN